MAVLARLQQFHRAEDALGRYWASPFDLDAMLYDEDRFPSR
ncbi:hypothetical protein [Streptomyces sp. NPDC056983]